MTGPLREHGALARGAFAVAVLVSLAVLFAPPGDVPSSPPGVDKVVHFSLFAVLASTGRWAGVGQSVLAALLVLYAAGSELLQGTPLVDRDASIGDFVADSAGVVVGLLLWRLVATRRTRTPG
ncbi:VanZ family protein [Modestobacter excelsi]|uniref:VanZ family protein n=1 Tax=Modestobacter excelsi TaxID=2213161 RepID=UPI00110CA3F5|nr:VanZ family protein [Modestobacter excelsi]